MQTTLGKWGNSLAIRIPAALAKQAGLSEGCETEWVLKNKELVLRPVKKRVRLAEILANMKPMKEREKELIRGETRREADEWVWEHGDEDDL